MADNEMLTEEEEEKLASLRPLSDRIYFGSLEEQEKRRVEIALADVESKKDGNSVAGIKEGMLVFESGGIVGASGEAGVDNEQMLSSRQIEAKKKPNLGGIEEAVAAGNIQKVGPSAETYELSVGSQKERELQEDKYSDLLLKRRARTLAVPTDVLEVRERLRELGEPVTLFGERELERRDRLREILAKMDASGELDQHVASRVDAQKKGSGKGQQEALPAELFYTEGSQELLKTRHEIARFSIPRARDRLLRAKAKRESMDEDQEKEAELVLTEMGSCAMQSSEIGDDRPLSGCSFSSDASMIATCSWSGAAKIWSMPGVTKMETLKGHTERLTDICFRPNTSRDSDPTLVSLATASADRTAILWSLQGRQLSTLTGHLDRLARLAFHPSGRFLGTASFDKTWRLWDVETSVELLLQEGHSRAVYCVGFHPDGSLAASAGMDSLCRLWDLRTGRSILTLEGHVKPILSLDFSPSGYLLATASEDHSCRLWDLRKKAPLSVLPAHSSLLSQCRFEPRDGLFLLTASYDNTARIWSIYDFRPVKTLAGHEGKVMGVDVAMDGQYIATVSYDRTIKLWFPDDSAAMDETF